MTDVASGPQGGLAVQDRDSGCSGRCKPFGANATPSGRGKVTWFGETKVQRLGGKTRQLEVQELGPNGKSLMVLIPCSDFDQLENCVMQRGWVGRIVEYGPHPGLKEIAAVRMVYPSDVEAVLLQELELVRQSQTEQLDLPLREKPANADATGGNSCQSLIDAAKELVAAGYSPAEALEVLRLAGGQQHAAA